MSNNSNVSPQSRHNQRTTLNAFARLHGTRLTAAKRHLRDGKRKSATVFSLAESVHFDSLFTLLECMGIDV